MNGSIRLLARERKGEGGAAFSPSMALAPAPPYTGDMHLRLPSDGPFPFRFDRKRLDHPDVPAHQHDGYEVYCLLAGDVDYFVENRVYPLAVGDVMITDPYEVHTPIFRSDRPYERICIQFDDALTGWTRDAGYDLASVFRDRARGQGNRVPLAHAQKEEFLGILARIERAAASERPLDRVLTYTYVLELLALVNRALLDGPGEVAPAGVPEPVQAVLRRIDAGLDGDLSLHALADAEHLSPDHLGRLFKRSTGLGLHDYVLAKRIARAKELLREGRSVTEDGAAARFGDYANFIRTFKKAVGVPPGAYRRL